MPSTIEWITKLDQRMKTHYFMIGSAILISIVFMIIVIYYINDAYNNVKEYFTESKRAINVNSITSPFVDGSSDNEEYEENNDEGGASDYTAFTRTLDTMKNEYQNYNKKVEKLNLSNKNIPKDVMDEKIFLKTFDNY